MEDEIDVNILRSLSMKSKKPNIQNTNESTSSSASQRNRDPELNIKIDDLYYNMNHANRGQAIIFNHYTFDDRRMAPRSGTDIDRDELEKTLIAMKFSVNVYNDRTYGQIYAILDKVSNMDHTNSDCLLIAVMSHGEKNLIHAKDVTYSPESLWEPFVGKRCLSLAGKPKIFLIQACRGEQVDQGLNITARSSLVVADSFPASAVKYTIPTMADLLIMYSTYEGHVSFRNPRDGSWFIHNICKELNNSICTYDLVTLLTIVNRKISIECQSNSPANRDYDKMKQVGTIVSTLLRLIKF